MNAIGQCWPLIMFDVALSLKRTSVDLQLTAGMTPLQYLQKHCKISSRRMAHCKKIFVKQDKDRDAQLNREVLRGLFL